MRKKIKLNKKELVAKISILVVLGIALLASCLFFSNPIEAALGIGKTGKSGKYVEVNVVTQNSFVVHYIDVKQADCTFIELPDGKTILIDAGDEGTADEVVEYISAVLAIKHSFLFLIASKTSKNIVYTARKINPI